MPKKSKYQPRQYRIPWVPEHKPAVLVSRILEVGVEHNDIYQYDCTPIKMTGVEWQKMGERKALGTDIPTAKNSRRAMIVRVPVEEWEIIDTPRLINCIPVE